MNDLNIDKQRKKSRTASLYSSASAQANLLDLSWHIAERLHDQTPVGQVALERSLAEAQEIVNTHKGEPWLLPICAKSPLLLEIYRKTVVLLG